MIATSDYLHQIHISKEKEKKPQQHDQRDLADQARVNHQNCFFLPITRSDTVQSSLKSLPISDPFAIARLQTCPSSEMILVEGAKRAIFYLEAW